MTDTRLVNITRYTLLPLGDVALFNLAFWIAYAGLGAFGSPVRLETYRELAFFAWVLPPVAFHFAGLYRTWDEYAFAKGIDGILSGVTGALVLLLVVIWGIRDRLQALEAFEQGATAPDEAQQLVWGFPTRALVIVLVLAPLLLWGWRLLANECERRFIGLSARPRRALIVGNMDASDLRRLSRSERPPYRLIGFLADRMDARAEAVTPCRGPRSRAADVLAEQAPDEAFLVASDFPRDELFATIETCYANGVRPRLVLGVYEALLAATRTRLQGAALLCRFRTAGITGWNQVVKRLIDVTVSATALAVAVPFFLLPACIAIVVESKGWPVFSQERAGLMGRRFRVYKLRTMVIDAAVRGGPLTESGDPRITRVGQFLRRTSIDELPQLWNVLKGEMSLVGPRAVIPYVAEHFQEWERLSLTVRPGMTGLAQISGRDEIGFHEKSLLNLYYVRNYSIWLDLRILFDTVGVVLSMEGTGGTRQAENT